MFNNLAAYLLGTNTPAATRPTNTGNNQPSSSTSGSSFTINEHNQHHRQHQRNISNQQLDRNIRLSSAASAAILATTDVDENDEDWVLVDNRDIIDEAQSRDSEGNSELESGSDEDSDHEQSSTEIIDTDDITHLLLARDPSPVITYHPLATVVRYPHHSTPTTIVSGRSASLLGAPLPTTTTTTSASQLLLPNTPLEESWFLTPPPCFTSTGPVHMETSPLENLLIEHPSMSVYQQQTTAVLKRNATTATATALLVDAAGKLEAATTTTVVVLEEVEVEVSDLEDEEALFEVDEIVERGYLRVQQQQQRRRRGNGQRGGNRVEVVRQRQQQQQERYEGVRNKHAQKVQIRKACESLKRGYLERNNKAREVNFRNQRLRRGERSQGSTRSNANNNRKCC